MKAWLFCLSLYVILVGCAPDDIASPAQPPAQVRPQSQPYPPAQPQPQLQAQTQPQFEQILDNTEWLLDHALIDGTESERFGWLAFYDESIHINDGCAGQWHESVGEGPVYMASEEGAFALAEDRTVLSDHLEGVVCEVINEENGTTEGITTPWFSSAFEQVVAYELQDEELRLYFPEDRSNVFVFRAPTAQVPPGDIATPNPAGQILDGTTWVLDHAIIEGEVRALMSHETFQIHFSAESVRFSNGCNQMEYRNEDGRPAYVAAENGDFAFPWGEPVLISTAMGCALVDEESGEVHEIDGPDFMPEFNDIVAYELSAGELRLYYPEDKQNVLVFGAMSE